MRRPAPFLLLSGGLSDSDYFCFNLFNLFPFEGNNDRFKEGEL